MKVLCCIIFLYSIVTLLYANCNVEKFYALEGRKTVGSNNVTCPNKSDNCALLIANIPEFFVGQYQDCSSNIFDFIQNTLYDKRPDLKIELESDQFIDKTKVNCNKNSITQKSGPFLPSNYSIFLSCAPLGQDPSTQNAPNLPPLPSSKPLQNCDLGNGKSIICTEGYCTFFEYSINNTNTFSTSSGYYYGCPNGLFDTMSNLVLNGSNSGADFSKLQDLSTVCVNQTTNLSFGAVGNYQYFYYINCNADGKAVVQNIPKLPPKLNPNSSKECPYEVSGYFANKTSQIKNKTIKCPENYCAYVDVKVLNVNGRFQGCPSSIQNIITEINKETKGALNNTLSSFINKCNKKTYEKVNIIDIVDIYMDCYDGDHPDMSGNSSSTLKISLLSFTILMAYFLRYI
uniref:Transmembrane protein n=1 Tax=Strongyloides stercoralis TaxID=6248 RepID=A0A0K0EQV5_STRER